jgi:O-methyltransferase
MARPKSMPGELPLEIITAFNEGNAIQQLYDASIQSSQEGRHDNLLKRLRFYVLHQLATQAVRRFPNLSVAECGCWWGHSTQMLSRIMRDQSDFTGQLHVFDSFEGLSEFKDQDHSEFKSSPKRQEATRKNFKSDLAHVSSHLSDFPFVRIHEGWIPTRFDDVKDDRFSLVTVDVDLYEPTRDAVRFFYPRLQPGGCMYFDDYGYNTYPGAKLAVDELRQEQSPAFFLELPAGAAFLIK